MRPIYAVLAIRMIRLARFDLARSERLSRDGDEAFERSRERMRLADAWAVRAEPPSRASLRGCMSTPAQMRLRGTHGTGVEGRHKPARKFYNRPVGRFNSWLKSCTCRWKPIQRCIHARFGGLRDTPGPRAWRSALGRRGILYSVRNDAGY
jgi:hypothetical protein